MANDEALKNFIGGEWLPSKAELFADVKDPATSQRLARVPLSPKSEVEQWKGWSRKF